MTACVFPKLAQRPCGALELDALAVAWHKHCHAAKAANPFLDPEFCRAEIGKAQRARGWEWSYGGYLEDRRHLWAGSYLDRTGNYLHLGLDLNAPSGTLVAATQEACVMLIDTDSDQAGGWGTRIFLLPVRPDGEPLLLIYAHIRAVLCRVGQTVLPGEIVAEVDDPPSNGNWYPHLHVQAIRKALFEEILTERFEELDGYGPPGLIANLRVDYPDPTRFALGLR